MESTDILAELMAESPVAENHGLKSTDRLPIEHNDMDGQAWLGTHTGLDGQYRAAMDAIGGGCSIISPGEGGDHSHGAVAHRGVLTEDEAEWVDLDEVRRRAAAMLGSSVYQLEKLYGTNNCPDAESRAAIDEQFLHLQESGANMHVFAAVLGWTIRDERSNKMNRALARARKARREDR